MSHREYRAKIQQTESDSLIDVAIIAPQRIEELPCEEADVQLSALLHQIRVRPEVALYGFATLASYVNPPARLTLLGYNTMVELSIPYTLHLPNDLVFDVICPQTGPAKVVFHKVWTNLASGSNNAEVIADDQLLYYGPAQPESPNVPQAPELGPWPHFSGKNVEVAKDTHGIFRYTRFGHSSTQVLPASMGQMLTRLCELQGFPRLIRQEKSALR